MHKWYVSLPGAVRVFADVAIIKIPNIEKITNKIISNYTNIFYLDNVLYKPVYSEAVEPAIFIIYPGLVCSHPLYL